MEFYKEHSNRPFFDDLVAFMTSGRVTVMALARVNAVTEWRRLLGPTDSVCARTEAPKSIRALFGENNRRNAAHGSDSTASAHREARFFFPGIIVQDYESTNTPTGEYTMSFNKTLLAGLTALCKAKPADPVVWLADWLHHNNPAAPTVAEPSEE